MAEPVYEVSSPYFTKKRRHNNDREYEQQETNKDQECINGEQYLYEPGDISHSKGQM